MSDLQDLLSATATRIGDYRGAVAARPVVPSVDLDKLLAAFGGPLPREGSKPEQVIAKLIAAAEPGLVATTGPRYFGFVVGGALPAATCADMLAVGWDQPAFNAVTSPAAAAVEQVVGDWLKQLLRLPATASFGLVTGAQGANTVALAAARHRVLADAGWDVEADGLCGAPSIRVVASAERHATISSVRARSRTSMAHGCTSTEPSGCGQRPANAPRRSSPESNKPIPGASMATSG